MKFNPKPHDRVHIGSETFIVRPLCRSHDAVWIDGQYDSGYCGTVPWLVASWFDVVSYEEPSFFNPFGHWYVERNENFGTTFAPR